MRRYRLSELAVLTLWVMAFIVLFKILARRSGIGGLQKFTEAV